MRKVVYTLALPGYPEEMTNITFPYLKHYAYKIGADFHVINTRKFPEWPARYEKLQIFELGKDVDWNIYFDADALISPELFDITAFISKDTVVFNGKDMAANRFKPDRFFLRDGRYIGACNWLSIASDWCIELFKPLDMTPQEAEQNIFLCNSEAGSGLMDKLSLIDDYVLSRNMAKYGLKHTTIEELKAKIGRPMDQYFWHGYNCDINQKIMNLMQVVHAWNRQVPLETVCGS